MSDKLDNTADHKLLSLRIPTAEWHAIETTASRLGLSIADVGRLKLRSGSVEAALDDIRKGKS